jgi:four helix bundle protein
MPLAHHNLVVWQRADDLFVDIHQLTHKRFPSHEKYELSSQLRRAAYSVPANIVEGTEREHERESLHFLSIACASLAELGYGLHAARRLGYLLPAEYDEFERRLRMIAAPLRGLMRRYRTGNGLAPAKAARRPSPRRA